MSETSRNRRFPLRAWGAALAVLAAAGGVATAQNAPPAAVRGDPYAVPLRADQAAMLLRALQDAPTHGLADGAFPAPSEAALFSNPNPVDRLAAQRQLIGVTLAYARAVRTGRLAGGAFPADWGLRPAAYDPAPDFAVAVQEDRLAAWLADLPPPYVGYEALQDGLKTYREIQRRVAGTPCRTGRP